MARHLRDERSVRERARDRSRIMRAPSHVLLASGAWAALAAHTGYPVAAETLLAAGLGGLAPDIDHPGSWLGRRLIWLSWPIRALFGHRGITHSGLALALGAVAAILGGGTTGGLLEAFWVGYATHLAGDWLTEAGIPLMWPDRQRFRAPCRISSGGLAELVVVALIMAALALLGDADGSLRQHPWLETAFEWWRGVC